MRFALFVVMVGCTSHADDQSVCDDSFAYLTLSVVNTQGAPVIGLDHETVLAGNDVSPTNPIDGSGSYTVFDDSLVHFIAGTAPHQIEIQFSRDADALITYASVRTDSHGCHVQWADQPSTVIWPH